MAILAECPQCHKKQAVKNRICDCGADLVKLKRSGKVHYWIQYRLPGGKQRKEHIGFSIEEARTAEGKRRAQKRENRIFDILPEAKITFSELTSWYLGLERVKALPSLSRIEIALNRFNSAFGDTLVKDIKPVQLENYQQKRIQDGMAAATIDREIGEAKTMINRAFDNDMIGGETIRTFKKVKKLLKRNSNARDRIISKEELEAILHHAKPHLKAILVTGFYSGMRSGEILSLTWDKVNMEKRIIKLEASDTKDREPREIPIGDDLYRILRDIPRALHDNHVFLFRGKPIRSIRKSLKYACEKAKLVYGRFKKDGIVMHDLRHSFNTHMRKAGVPESVIMEITGHSTREMFDRYNTVDRDDKKEAIGRLQSYLDVTQAEE